MSTEKREKKRKLNSRPEIDSFSTANETAEVPINTTDNLTTKKKRKVAEAEISVKDGSAGVQGTDGEGDVKTKRKQEKKGSKQSDTQPPHGISDTTATNEVTRLGADVAAPENDKKKQKSKKEKKGNKKSDAETNNVSKASAVDGSATERVEGNETEGDNKPKKKKKDKKSRSQSDDAVLGDTESGNDNISQKKRKRTTDEEPDNTVDASDKASKSDGPTPDQTAEPAKKKAKRKKKTQKPRPKTKTKPTAVQKLKQRQSMREKLLAKEINGVTSQPPDAESEAADGATKAQNPDTSVKKPVSIAPTSGPGESKRRQAAAEYLRLFVHDRKEWKFQKVRQVWILKNLWYTHQLDDETFNFALEYIKDLSHKARYETIEEAREVIRIADPKASVPKKGKQEGNKIKFSDSDDEDSGYDEEEKSAETEKNAEIEQDESTPAVNQVIVKRAKAVLNVLKTFL